MPLRSAPDEMHCFYIRKSDCRNRTGYAKRQALHAFVCKSDHISRATDLVCPSLREHHI